MKPLWLGVGANAGRRRAQLDLAEKRLRQRLGCRPLLRSSYYTSTAWGVTHQAPYLNKVCMLHTRYPARRLLKIVKKIEAQAGRRAIRRRWGRRPLDIDLLQYGQQHVATPHLVIPHRWLQQRDFVLLPWLEVAAQHRLPNGSRLSDLVKHLPEQTLRQKKRYNAR